MVASLLRTGLSALAAVFLTIAGYHTLQLWLTAPAHNQSDEAVLVDQSSEELAKLSAEERSQRAAREQKLLQHNPLQRAPLKRLAGLAKADGHARQADELLLLAADRSLRDAKAQTDVLPILLARGDFAGVVNRLDGQMRSTPERLSELLPIAGALAEVQESRAPLVATLAQNPPWRGHLISYITKKAARPTVSYGLFADLRKTAAPPTASELRALIARLLDDNDYETAYFVWLDFLTDVELRKVGHIYDGGFELDSKNLFFDWTYKPIKNADLRIVPHGTSAADRALRIDFLNPSSRFANLSQLLRLYPGIYTLSGQLKAEYQPADVGLVWRLYCVGHQQRLVAETSPSPQSRNWTNFELAFDIPANDCATQRLQLELNSRAALDNKIRGTVIYDNIGIASRG